MVCSSQSKTPLHTELNYLNIKVIGSDIHTSVYDKRDYFGYSIANFSWWSGDVPRLPSYSIYIFQLVRFVRCRTVTYPLRVSWNIRPLIEPFHLFRSASTMRTLFQDLQSVSSHSFSTVHLHILFDISILHFPFLPQVSAVFQSLLLSCLIICPIIFHLRHFISSLSGLIRALSNSSSVRTWSCQHILKFFLGICCGKHKPFCRLPCSFFYVSNPYSRTGNISDL